MSKFDESTNQSRRNFTKALGAGLAAIPVVAAVRPAFAADAPMVDPESAQAQALQYKAESEMDGQMCNNCALFQGAADAEAGGCPLFAGSSVGAKAWCSAWVAKG